MEFFSQIIFIEQGSAERDNADNKLSCISPFNLCRCRQCIAISAFQLGTLAFITITSDPSSAWVTPNTGSVLSPTFPFEVFIEVVHVLGSM